MTWMGALALALIVAVLAATGVATTWANGFLLSFVEIQQKEFGVIDALDGARIPLVSPDGKHVYVTSNFDNSLSAFTRDAASGKLTYVETHTDGASGVDGLEAVEGAAIAPDGNHVYAAGTNDDAVAVFARNATTGALAFVESKKNGVGGITGLDGVYSMVVSPDNIHLYVSGFLDDSLAVFKRSATSGSLTFIESLKDGVGGVDGLDGARAVVVSPDGKNVYVSSSNDHAVAAFKRDSSTGMLTYVESEKDGVASVDGMLGAWWVDIAPDGNHLYATGRDDDSVAVFSRESASGTLAFVEFIQRGTGGADLLDETHGVAVSPDGKHVLVAAARFDDALTVFSRNAATGKLTFVSALRDNVSGVNGLADPFGIAISPDGTHVYVGGSADDAVSVFTTDPDAPSALPSASSWGLISLAVALVGLSAWRLYRVRPRSIENPM
jgi:6-phosphogluconolactonase (cycloisomerase 2 family)